jgi:hypothetical protein
MIPDSTSIRPFEVPPDLGLLENQNTKLSKENKLLRIFLVSIIIAGIVYIVTFEYLKPKKQLENK